LHSFARVRLFLQPDLIRSIFEEFVMPNMAVVLRDEIRRLARREIRAMVGSTQKAVARYRREIAHLKRLLNKQEKNVSRLQQQVCQQQELPAGEEEPLEGVRFSARSVRAQRQRLGLSAADYGRLIGVTALTVYNWESGKSRPRKAQLANLVAVRGIGKREAAERLQS
jgi:DNA-binding transcriptional regulator YiaG